MGEPELGNFDTWQFGILGTNTICSKMNSVDFCCEKQSLSRSENKWKSAFTQKIPHFLKIFINLF